MKFKGQKGPKLAPKEKKPFSAAEHEAKKMKTPHPSGKPRWQRRKETKKPKGGCSVYVPPKATRMMMQQEDDIRKALEFRAKVELKKVKKE
jgi:hypothetical protein